MATHSIESLYQLWTQDPYNEEVTLTLVQQLLFAQHYTMSLQIMDYFLQKHPNYVPLLEAKMKVLYNTKEYDEAKLLLHTLLQYEQKAEYYMFLGHVEKRHQQYIAAAPHYKKALKLTQSTKEKADLHDYLGHVYMFSYQFNKAQEQYKKALSYNTQHISAKIHQINSYCREGEFAKAHNLAAHYLKKHPSHSKLMMNASIAFLSNGDYAHAWPLFHHRWDNKYYAQFKRDYNVPIWQGEPLAGKKLFIQGEQGIGDVLLFAGYLPRIYDANIAFYLAADKRLMPLLTRSLPFIIDASPYYLKEAEGAAHYACDYILLLCDLPLILGLKTHQQHRIDAYLQTDKAWRDALRFSIQKQYKNKKIVGFCWWSLADSDMRDRSIPVQDLLQHLNADDRVLVPLQYGEEQLTLADNAANAANITYHREATIDNMKNLDGVAALADACDVIITNDQSIINFAGLMGKKCLILLPYAPNWHYAHATSQTTCAKEYTGSDVVWYANITTLLKHKSETWQQALPRMQGDIDNFINS